MCLGICYLRLNSSARDCIAPTMVCYYALYGPVFVPLPGTSAITPADDFLKMAGNMAATLTIIY